MSLTDFQQWYEISPIVLVGGIAANANSSGQMPISNLLQSRAFADGLSSGLIEDLGILPPSDPFFAHFRPLPGSSLIENEIGHYTFANQAVAANAIIIQPKHVSFVMVCPARGIDGFATKFTILNSLRQTLDQHSALGGMYTLAMPACLFNNALLLSLKDITSQDFKQAQVYFQWDFEIPLVTQQQAAALQQSPRMAQMTSGVQIVPDQNGKIGWSGPSNQPASANASSVLQSGGSSQAVYGGAASPSTFGIPNSQATAGGAYIGTLL